MPLHPQATDTPILTVMYTPVPPTATPTPPPTATPLSTLPSRGAGSCTFNADVSHRYQLSNSNDWEPSWSPDGCYIAFASQHDGNPEIYLTNADGSGQHQVTRGSQADEQCPSWRP